MTGRIEALPSTSALAQRATGLIMQLLNDALARKGRATIALSGGSTPRIIYERLGSDEFAGMMNWGDVHFFFGDERCVPPSSQESNYRMVKETLLAGGNIPERNVHRIMAELQPREAALQYEEDLRKTFDFAAGQLPSIDIVLLGLGEDGHTASLFPSSPVLHERARLAVEVFVEKKSQYRITLTLPVLDNAGTLIFLVAGRDKAEIVREVLEDNTRRYPAQLVRPVSGQLYWLIDAEAAAGLHSMEKK